MSKSFKYDPSTEDLYVHCRDHIYKSLISGQIANSNELLYVYDLYRVILNDLIRIVDIASIYSARVYHIQYDTLIQIIMMRLLGVQIQLSEKHIYFQFIHQVGHKRIAYEEYTTEKLRTMLKDNLL